MKYLCNENDIPVDVVNDDFIPQRGYTVQEEGTASTAHTLEAEDFTGLPTTQSDEELADVLESILSRHEDMLVADMSPMVPSGVAVVATITVIIWG